MLVADCPELLTWLNGKLESVVWPALSAQFGSKAAEEMWLYDAFVLRFDNQPNQQGLGVHVDDDGLGLSINALLSSPDDFDGGGTFFEDENLGEQVDADGKEADVTVGFTVTPEQGELVSHHGGLRHSSVPTTGGMRYILVAFLRDRASEPPMQSYCPNAQASARRRPAGNEARVDYRVDSDSVSFTCCSLFGISTTIRSHVFPFAQTRRLGHAPHAGRLLRSPPPGEGLSSGARFSVLVTQFSAYHLDRVAGFK